MSARVDAAREAVTAAEDALAEAKAEERSRLEDLEQARRAVESRQPDAGAMRQLAKQRLEDAQIVTSAAERELAMTRGSLADAELDAKRERYQAALEQTDVRRFFAELAPILRGLAAIERYRLVPASESGMWPSTGRATLEDEPIVPDVMLSDDDLAAALEEFVPKYRELGRLSRERASAIAIQHHACDVVAELAPELGLDVPRVIKVSEDLVDAAIAIEGREGPVTAEWYAAWRNTWRIDGSARLDQRGRSVDLRELAVETVLCGGDSYSALNNLAPPQARGPRIEPAPYGHTWETYRSGPQPHPSAAPGDPRDPHPPRPPGSPGGALATKRIW